MIPIRHKYHCQRCGYRTYLAIRQDRQVVCGMCHEPIPSKDRKELGL